MAKDTSKLRRKAAEQLKKGSKEKALSLLKEACEKDQYDPENWLQLAEVQLGSGDTAGASDSMFRTTDIYARCGMVKEAFAACCRTLDLAPTHGPARRMGRFLISRLPEGEQEAADELLDQAGKAKPAAPPPAARAAEPALAAPAPAAEPAPAAPAAPAAAPAPETAAPAPAPALAPEAATPPAEPAAPAAAEEEDEEAQEQTVDRGGRFRPATPGPSAEAEAGPEPGEDEKTIDRGAARQPAEGEEELEEKTIERGAVPRRVEGAEPAEARHEAAPEALPEEVAESAATSPWWTGTGQPPPLAPAEGAPAEGTPEATDDDVTLPVWPPRAVLPPPPVEILTLEIEAELPESDGRPQPPVRGEIESPAAPPPAPEAAAPPAPEAVPELIAPSFSGPAELPPDMPVPVEPPLDALSLRELLGVADGNADGPVEILVDAPAEGGEPHEATGPAALRSPLLGDLDPALLKRLVDGAELQRRRRGEVVMRQGTFGTALYVILRGEVAVVRENPPPSVTLAKLRTGAFFGEMSLITNFPRSATVVAESDLDLLVVPRRQVSDLCMADPQVLRTLLRFCRGRMVATMMAVSPIFQPLGPEVRKRLLQHFRLREYVPGAEVVTEGVESGGLHIVMAGRLQVARRDDGEGQKMLAMLGPGDVFGEMSLLNKGKAMATITAETRVWVLVLPTQEFENAISKEHPELVAYLGAVADERRAQNQQLTGARAFRDGRIETP